MHVHLKTILIYVTSRGFVKPGVNVVDVIIVFGGDINNSLCLK